MSNQPKRPSRFRFFRRLWKPAAVTGVGSAASTIWFEELMLYAQEILALIFLPIMAGAVYLLDYFFFKSQIPRREDLNSNTEGVKK